jgi:energy-coupling factor transporter ATP-binding protein EcfA2
MSEKPKKFTIRYDEGVVLLGKRGSGKTSAIRFLITKLLKSYNFTILDSLGNYADLDGQENIDYHTIIPSDTDEVTQIIDEALEQGDRMVVIDEIDLYSIKKNTGLYDLINLGRNFGVGYIAASRRTASIDKSILANARWIIVFQHILPQDLEVLTDWFSLPEEKFRDLQEHEVLIFRDGEEIWKGIFPYTKAPEQVSLHRRRPKAKGKEPEKSKEKEPKEKEPEDEGEAEPEVEIEEPKEEEKVVENRCIVCGKSVDDHTPAELDSCLDKLKGFYHFKEEENVDEFHLKPDLWLTPPDLDKKPRVPLGTRYPMPDEYS